MNIVVCIKQVPASTHVKMDPVTHTMIRDGAGTTEVFRQTGSSAI